MSCAIKLVVGLCNPGPEYEKTRHNAGAWLVQRFAEAHKQKFVREKKFKGFLASIAIANQGCWLLLPTTYMNNSGQSVKSLASFYKILPEEILIAHDELDFAPGIIRLKKGGGSGGHNGLKDVVSQLSSANFYRLRIGIGHPGDRKHVLDYVLNPPNKSDNELIQAAINSAVILLPDLIAGKVDHVMQQMHTAQPF